MALPTVANTVKVALNGRVAGQEVINVLHFTSPVPVTLTLMNSLSTDIAGWLSDYMTTMSTAYTISSMTMTDLSTSSGLSVTYNFTTLGGTLTTGAEANNVAACVTHRTAKRGRSFRGRTYVGAIDGGKVSGPLDFISSYQTLLVTVFTELLNSSAFHSFVLSVVSYFVSGAVRPAGVSTPVNAFSMDSHIDSQRRRLSGRGA